MTANHDLALPAEITGLALCAGAASLELGIHAALAGQYRCVAYCERDAYAASCLVARMEEKALDPAPIWDDVRTFNGHAFTGLVDLVSAGFPCQPWSSAGKRGGTGDERWIWPDIARVIGEVRPAVVFLENVPGLILGGIEHVLGNLALCGFDAEWDCFSAAEVGAPHKRERIFILAWNVSDASRRILRLAAKRDLRRQAECRHAEPRNLGGQAMGDADLQRRDTRIVEPPRRGKSGVGSGGSGESMADADRARRKRRVQPALEGRPGSHQHRGTMADSDLERLEGQPPKRLHAGGQRRHDPARPGDRPCWAWPPGPEDAASWLAYLRAGGPIPAICRGTHGVAGQLVDRKERLRLLGNGTVPPQVQKAFEELASRAISGR